jgi:hypothetical protein
LRGLLADEVAYAIRSFARVRRSGMSMPSALLGSAWGRYRSLFLARQFHAFSSHAQEREAHCTAEGRGHASE